MIYKSMKKKKKRHVTIVTAIDNLPIYYLMMIASLSILTQLRVFHPYHVNRVVNNFISIGTNGEAKAILERIIGVVMGYEVN